MGIKGKRVQKSKSKKKKRDSTRHEFLVEKGKKWLRGQKGKNWGCPIVFGELSTQCDEKPDVLGFSSSRSTLIECKTSRNDFKRDQKKMFRSVPYTGMGNFRLYMCPTDLIKEEELPDNWGLIYVSDGGRCRLVVKPNYQNCNNKNQHTYMYSIIRRLYNKNYEEIQNFFGRYT